jgi:predicted metalloendopeptidase
MDSFSRSIDLSVSISFFLSVIPSIVI